MDIKNKSITSREDDFAKWYTDIVTKAEMAAYSKIKGSIIIEPRGYAIWENIQRGLDKMFKDTGHENVYMPMLIPESLLQKEANHVEGFAPEVAWVTKGGNNDLEEKLGLRPTSEVLFCDYYSSKIQSYRDLPKLYNQWCNVFRWEKETRPFLRGREFLWQEGHTVHETSKEAEEETHRMLNIYKTFFEEYLAIPVITGRKTEKEKFAGADYTLTVEALMYNGISLQSATSHYFGQRFSIPFDIKFLNRNGEYENPYQTSWGTSTRMIAAIIMVHGDDNGLVLPPRIAPTKVVIVPISKSEEVKNKAYELLNNLKDAGISTIVDDSEKSPGFRYAEHEMNGVPIRIELGPRDLEKNQVVLARRDTYKKSIVPLEANLVNEVNTLLDDIQKNMYETAKARNAEKTYECTQLDEVAEIMENRPGFVKAMWCGEEECEMKFKEIRGTKSRCIVDNEKPIDDKCICCKKEAKHLVYWGIQY